MSTELFADPPVSDEEENEERDEEVENDGDDDIEGEVIDGDDIEDEESSSESEDEEDEEIDTDTESVSFESDEEADENDGEIDGDENTEEMDLSEFYDETPKKSSKGVSSSRKHTNPPKVSKAKRTKKRKGDETTSVPFFLTEDVREITLRLLKSLSIKREEKEPKEKEEKKEKELKEKREEKKEKDEKLSEKDCLALERSIYNHAVRKTSATLGRPLKKSDLSRDGFKFVFSQISYEAVCKLSGGMSVDECSKMLQSDKTGFSSFSFRDEQFNDKRQTSNIENPPKVMRGIHTCSRCRNDESQKGDDDRGKRVDWYQKQTRSCDEPMTTFCECTDCGKKWKF